MDQEKGNISIVNVISRITSKWKFILISQLIFILGFLTLFLVKNNQYEVLSLRFTLTSPRALSTAYGEYKPPYSNLIDYAKLIIKDELIDYIDSVGLDKTQYKLDITSDDDSAFELVFSKEKGIDFDLVVLSNYYREISPSYIKYYLQKNAYSQLRNLTTSRVPPLNREIEYETRLLNAVQTHITEIREGNYANNANLDLDTIMTQLTNEYVAQEIALISVKEKMKIIEENQEKLVEVGKIVKTFTTYLEQHESLDQEIIKVSSKLVFEDGSTHSILNSTDYKTYIVNGVILNFLFCFVIIFFEEIFGFESKRKIFRLFNN